MPLPPRPCFQPLDPMAGSVWGCRTFGGFLFALTTSFGIQSAPVLLPHGQPNQCPPSPVIWWTPGLLGRRKTTAMAGNPLQLLKLTFKWPQPEQGSARMEALHGRLWRPRLEDMDLYLRMRKVSRWSDV